LERLESQITNSPELEEAIRLDARLSVSAWGENTDGAYGDDTVFLVIRPGFNSSASYETGTQFIKEVKVKNLKVSNGPNVGNVKRIYPGGQSVAESCRGFFFDGCDSDLLSGEVEDQGASYTYNGVDTRETYSQVSNDNFAPEFAIIVSDIASIDSAAILERDGSYNASRVLEYAEADAANLGFRLEFDVEIETSTLGTYYKSFYLDVTGDQVLSAVSNLPMMSE